MNVSRRMLASGAVILFLSLAVNLFMAGVFAGRMMRHSPPPGVGPENVRQFSLERIAEDLPPEAKKELRQNMQGQRRSLMDRQQALRTAHQNLARILGAETFDQMAATDAFAAMRQQQVQMQKMAQDALIAAASRMPAENRQRLIGRKLGRSFFMHAPRRFEFRVEKGQEGPDRPGQRPPPTTE